jgi:hypothetical protein
MRTFEYRHPRYFTDIPVIVRVAPMYSIYGRCTDVSAEGLGVILVDELSTGDIVTVEFSLAGCQVCAKARIENCRNVNYYGLSFHFLSAQERNSVRHLIESVQQIK